MIHKNKLLVEKSDSGLSGYDDYFTDCYFIYNIESHRPGEFYDCRELFTYAFKSTTRYIGYILGRAHTIERLNKFFEIIEDRLKLKERTIFHRANFYIAIIKPSEFWLANSTRRGFFTLFIRAALRYNGREFNRAMMAYNLTNQILPVVDHFLQGHTKHTYKSLGGGVVSKFSTFRFGRAQGVRKDYKTLLVKP